MHKSIGKTHPDLTNVEMIKGTCRNEHVVKMVIATTYQALATCQIHVCDM